MCFFSCFFVVYCNILVKGWLFSLYICVGFVFIGFVVSLLLVFVGVWLQGVKQGIYEEVEVVSWVFEQWLKMLVGEMCDVLLVVLFGCLFVVVKLLGCICVNVLEVYGVDGSVFYCLLLLIYQVGCLVLGWFIVLVVL